MAGVNVSKVEFEHKMIQAFRVSLKQFILDISICPSRATP